MKIFKIGPLFRGTERWNDLFSVADGMAVLKRKSKETEISGFEYYYLNESHVLYRLVKKIINRFRSKENAEWLVRFLFPIQRLLIRKQLKAIAAIPYDEVHVSYNDFDESAELFLLIHPFLRKNVRITRVYKETRPQYNFFEKYAFKLADRIVLNEPENVDFFKKKYGNSIFEGKTVLTDLDEDAIGTLYINAFSPAEKMSAKDHKKHVVILAGRVMSDSVDTRSGSRLFYIPMIREFIDAGLIVHLHTLQILPDRNGIDQYHALSEQNCDEFFIEKPLDFENDWINAYRVLSRYDYGIMHNYIRGTSNTLFDMYNIPHRYYEYQLAGVAPLLKKDETVVLQRLFTEQNTGIIYDNPAELLKDHHIDFKVTDFRSYITALYGK